MQAPNALLERLEWRREIRNVMGRISHDYAVKQEGEVYRRYFSSREDVSLGLNEGGYRGAKAVAGYYDALAAEIALSSQLIQKAFPEELGDKTAEEVFGVGMVTYLPFESQVIEIADDGQTAKGIWNIRGSDCHLTTSGPVSQWTYGWAAVDFIREDGAWKIWHMQIYYNIHQPCGTVFGKPQVDFEPYEAFAPIGDFKLPEPNVPGPLFESYYPGRPHVQSPACPVPYATFADTFSYAV